MKKTDLIIIGGFLGSGKTTTILNTAKLLINKGYKIGIVTNDQGSDLVDTEFLKAWGLPVEQVEGGCFCSNIDEFMEKINSLAINQLPDIILAEPIGSSLDLIGKLYKPLNSVSQDNLCIKPLSIIVDPRRIKKLMMENNSSFHSEINYLFKKQLEEADIIVLNKIDTLSNSEILEINNYLRKTFKNTEIQNISAKESSNLENWIENVIRNYNINLKSVQIDNDIFTKANNHLGWLNLTSDIYCDNININNWIETFMNYVKNEFINNNEELGHLKIYAVSEGDWAKASLTTVLEEIDFYKKANSKFSYWKIIVNIRADIDIEKLMEMIKEIFRITNKDFNAEVKFIDIQ